MLMLRPVLLLPICIKLSFVFERLSDKMLLELVEESPKALKAGALHFLFPLAVVIAIATATTTADDIATRRALPHNLNWFAQLHGWIVNSI